MNCNFEYNGVSAPSVEELIHKLIWGAELEKNGSLKILQAEVANEGIIPSTNTEEKGYKFINAKNIFQSDLSYFNSEGDRVKSILENAWTLSENKYSFVHRDSSGHSITDKGKSVTELLGKHNNDTAVSNNSNYTDKSKTEFDQYVNFCTDFGTMFHTCVDQAIKAKNANRPFADDSNYKKSVDNLYNYITTISSISSNWGSTFENVKNAAEFIQKSNDPTAFKLMIDRTITDLIESMLRFGASPRHCKIMSEVPIKYQHPQTGDIYDGIIDAIMYDDQGNVWIFDYKTTNRNVFGPRKKQAYAFQLSAYKAILESLGIASQNIKLAIMPVIYKVNNLGEPVIEHSQSKAVSSISNLQMDMTAQAQLNRHMRMFFPITRSSLTVEEAAIKQQTLQSQLDKLIGPVQKKRSSVARIKARIESAIQNNKPYTFQSRKNEYGRDGLVVYRWEKNDDVYKAYPEEGDPIVGTLDQLAEAESKSLEESLYFKTEAISQAIASGNYDSIHELFHRDEKAATALLMAVEPYLSPEWSEIQIKELRERNIITMYNKMTHTYSFIIVSNDSEISESRIKDDKNTTIPPMANILYEAVKDQDYFKQFKEFDNIPGLAIKDHLTLETMLSILQYQKIIRGSEQGKINIGQIQVVSAASGQSTLGVNLTPFVQTLHLLEYAIKNNADVLEDGVAQLFSDSYSVWQDNFYIVDSKETVKQVLLNRLGGYKLNYPEVGLDLFSSQNIELDLTHIEDMKVALKQEFSGSFTPEGEPIATTPIGRIYIGLQKLATTLKRDDVHTEIFKQTSFGLSAAELFGAGYDLLKYGESRRYSFNGMLVAGMAQGLDNSISYASPDGSIRFFQELVSEASQQINVETIKIATEVNTATKKFLDAAGVSSVTRNLTGNTDSYYEQLYEQTEDGTEIHGNMILKNPYDPRVSLADPQREYLEVILWSINRLRMPHLDAAAKELSYEELKQNQQAWLAYKESVMQNDKYRHVPLVRKDGAKNLGVTWRMLFSKDQSLQDANKETTSFFRRLHERCLQQLEPMLLTPEQKKYHYQGIDSKSSEWTYHSPYNLQNEHRAETLLKNDKRDWEINLNYVTITYAAAQFSEVFYNQVLQMAGNIMGELQMAEIMTGQNLEDTKKALKDRIKISVFHTNLIKDELKTSISVVAWSKQLTSYLKIAGRPALWIKEMIVGSIKNVAQVYAEAIVNDTPITVAHLLKAATIVYTNGLFTENAAPFEGETLGDFRLINQLNNLYRINDRDLNVIGDTLSYDHNGLANIGSRMLYINTTSPDWFHRMTLLVGKMLADGTWDAHFLNKEGKLQYNAIKDKRYKEFLLYYTSHEGDLSHEPTDESYIKAKTLYQLKLQQLKKEGFKYLETGENGQFSIDLPVAYSQQEMNSFKEQVGMLFGYYSHEERTSVQKGLYWFLQTQFQTFLPGQWKYYFAPGNIDSSVGKTMHMVDPITKEGLYYKNEEGLVKIVKESELALSERTNPVYQFVHEPVEGVCISTLKTLNEICSGKWDSENNKDRHRRAGLFLFNFLLSLMLKALWGILAYMGYDAYKTAKESAILAAAMDTSRRVDQELNFFNSTIEPISELGIKGIDILPSLVSTATKAAGANYSLMDAANDVWPVISDTHLVG